jgi:hydrogenase maturation protein HypF
MAEHGIDEEVIGISLDGTGLGTDGKIWGGEFLIADLNKFRRFTHFDYIALPGGDKAIDEPWRTAFSFLYKYFGDNLDYESLPPFKMSARNKLLIIKEAVNKQINCPVSSGAGRLFDAVSAITGLCTVSAFDSEAPMRLESVINDDTDEYYPFDAGKPVVFADTFRAILSDLPRETLSVISAKFHNSVARVILEVSMQIRKETAINKVFLSGGVFQNKYLLEKSSYLLDINRFEIYTNRQVPSNDGGISLGQLVIASKKREICV